LSSEHRPECKLQTVNVKPKPNNYRSSAECWSVAEQNQAEAFGRTFGRCSVLTDETELRCTSTECKSILHIQVSEAMEMLTKAHHCLNNH